MQEIHRGDIFYVDKYAVTGSEQMTGRPAVIVSNDKNNTHAETVEIVYLTTAPKTDLPTHVTIRSISRESIALCEQVTTVSTSRLRDFQRAVTPMEMSQIETALLISLDLNLGAPVKPMEFQKPPVSAALSVTTDGKPVRTDSDMENKYRSACEKAADFEKQLIKANAELAIFKELYADMADRVYGALVRPAL